MRFDYNNFRYDIENPSTCPHCHNGIEPRQINQHADKGPGNSEVSYSIWRCTHRECRRIFVAVHTILGSGRAEFQSFLDGSPIGPHWPESILKLDSKFIPTYIQSLQAEYAGLNEISGMGFRKSIEYLVKDYVISKDASLVGKVEDAPLSSVISSNFNDPQESDLKDLLERATWLGNDMTHYLQYHENFDIDDLKELIKLVMDEIHSIEQKRHYIANIQSKYKKK
jgi:hypothetical protein